MQTYRNPRFESRTFLQSLLFLQGIKNSIFFSNYSQDIQLKKGPKRQFKS